MNLLFPLLWFGFLLLLYLLFAVAALKNREKKPKVVAEEGMIEAVDGDGDDGEMFGEEEGVLEDIDEDAFR